MQGGRGKEGGREGRGKEGGREDREIMGGREEGREGQWERRREGERSNMYILVYIQYCMQYATYIIIYLCTLLSKRRGKENGTGTVYVHVCVIMHTS